MSDFITLSCPSCGGKLQISSDIERFVCLHCGNEHIVRRGGGLIALLPVLETLQRIEQGTDRSVTELKGLRLRAEVEGLERDIRQAAQRVVREDYNYVLVALESISRATQARMTARTMAEATDRIMELSAADLGLFLRAYRASHWIKTQAVKGCAAVIENMVQQRQKVETLQAEIVELRSQF